MATVISQGTALIAAPPKRVLSYVAQYRTKSSRAACAPEREICVSQSDDYLVLIDVEDQDGIPVNLLGLTEARFVVAEKNTAGAMLIDKKLSDLTIRRGANTNLYFELRSAELGALSPGRKYHELRLTNSAGWHQTVMLGAFLIQDTLIGD